MVSGFSGGKYSKTALIRIDLYLVHIFVHSKLFSARFLVIKINISKGKVTDYKCLQSKNRLTIQVIVYCIRVHNVFSY